MSKKYYFCPKCNSRIDVKKKMSYYCREHGILEEYKNIDDSSNNNISEDDDYKADVAKIEQKNKAHSFFTIEGYDPQNLDNWPECIGCKTATRKTKRGIKKTVIDENIPYEYVLCPVCENDIHLSVFRPDVETYRICLAGSTKAGKTCYKSILLTLRQSYTSIIDVPVFPSPQPIDAKSLQVGADLPKSTSSITEKKGEEDEWNCDLEPEYFGFTYGDRQIQLIIYDIAGEDYDKLRQKKSKHLKQWENCIIKSDAIFFLIDPKQSFANHLNVVNWDNGEKKETGAEQVETRTVMDLILQDIHRLKTYNNIEKLPKLAYIYSKFDDPDIQKSLKEANSKVLGDDNSVDNTYLLWDSKDNFIYSDDNGNKELDLRKVIKQFTRDNDGRFEFTADESYLSCQGRCFVISALGIGSEMENKKIKKLGIPFRVLDPILWVIGKGDR